MHPRERLMSRLSPHLISFPIQPNIITSISVCQAVDEVDIHQHGIRITIQIHRTLSVSEMTTLQARETRHLSPSAHAF
ncbi:hypothetical protein TNCV_3576471 [Trichonephila clavipes]|nr:hypothetical protein TNCV_3576471 [Trichonephila clavipes]